MRSWKHEAGPGQWAHVGRTRGGRAAAVLLCASLRRQDVVTRILSRQVRDTAWGAGTRPWKRLWPGTPHRAGHRAGHPAVRAPYAALTSLQVSPAQECVGDTDLPPGRHLSPTDPDPE